MTRPSGLRALPIGNPDNRSYDTFLVLIHQHLCLVTDHEYTIQKGPEMKTPDRHLQPSVRVQRYPIFYTTNILLRIGELRHAPEIDTGAH